MQALRYEDIKPCQTFWKSHCKDRKPLSFTKDFLDEGLLAFHNRWLHQILRSKFKACLTEITLNHDLALGVPNIYGICLCKSRLKNYKTAWGQETDIDLFATYFQTALLFLYNRWPMRDQRDDMSLGMIRTHVGQ